MQTFLPYSDFNRSASCLDRARLGKQRVEVLQIINTLDSGSRWQNHPAVLMWKEYREALIHYGLAICFEWQKRGYKDSILEKLFNLSEDPISEINLPYWFGDERLHASHRSNLLRKDALYYNRFGWVESASLPYFWPSNY